MVCVYASGRFGFTGAQSDPGGTDGGSYCNLPVSPGLLEPPGDRRGGRRFRAHRHGISGDRIRAAAAADQHLWRQLRESLTPASAPSSDRAAAPRREAHRCPPVGLPASHAHRDAAQGAGQQPTPGPSPHGNRNSRLLTNLSRGQIVKHILDRIAVMAWFEIFANGYKPVSGSDQRGFDVAVFSLLRVARSRG